MVGVVALGVRSCLLVVYNFISRLCSRLLPSAWLQADLQLSLCTCLVIEQGGGAVAAVQDVSDGIPHTTLASAIMPP